MTERPDTARGARAKSAWRSGLVTLWSLTRSTGRLWRQTFFITGLWFCLGFTVHTLAFLASAQLGADHGVIALAVFVIGVVATLVALVMMIHSVEPFLRSSRSIPSDEPADDLANDSGGAALRVPGQVFVRERGTDVVASAVGPFLAVYAVWGFVDDQVRDLFFSNYVIQGLGGIENFSISFSPDRLPLYALVAGTAWGLRQVLSALTSRGRRRPLAFVGILAEAMWVFSLFAVLIIVVRAVVPWIRTRAAWAGLQDGWQQLLAVLPDWTLPFGLTVPRALDQGAAALVDTVLPGAWQAVALPLVWLALTATVLGWREFGGRDVLAGTRLEQRAARLPQGDRTRFLFALATSDLRTKYFPVLQALRLVAYAGPRFIGVYLVLATVLTAAQQGFDIAVTVLPGPQYVTTALLTDPFAMLVSGLIFTPLAICLYAAAFDEALGAVLRRGGAVDPVAPVSGGPRPESDRRPRTTASAPDRRTAPG